VFDNERIVEFVSDRMAEGQEDLAVIAGQLCDTAANNGSRDNMSLMIIQFTDGRSYCAPDEFVPVPQEEFERILSEEGARWLRTYQRFVENHANLNWEEVLATYGERIKELLPELSNPVETPFQWTSVPVSIPAGTEEPPTPSESESDEEVHANKS